jgi:hypothetical protein
MYIWPQQWKTKDQFRQQYKKGYFVIDRSLISLSLSKKLKLLAKTSCIRPLVGVKNNTDIFIWSCFSEMVSFQSPIKSGGTDRYTV